MDERKRRGFTRESVKVGLRTIRKRVDPPGPPEAEDDRLPTVLFVPPRCPNGCKSRPKTYRTYLPWRYHKCRECGMKYRSYEGEGEIFEEEKG